MTPSVAYKPFSINHLYKDTRLINDIIARNPPINPTVFPLISSHINTANTTESK